MNNVIAFPQPAAPAPVQATTNRSMTLFLHVKCTTLIIHLANTNVTATETNRIVKS
ncbi:hypothetical protein N9L47_00910 [Rhodobacteraceae bacterium]|nr:hypothetical protein [Paracoccaceae bacterium]